MHVFLWYFLGKWFLVTDTLYQTKFVLVGWPEGGWRRKWKSSLAIVWYMLFLRENYINYVLFRLILKLKDKCPLKLLKVVILNDLHGYKLYLWDLLIYSTIDNWGHILLRSGLMKYANAMQREKDNYKNWHKKLGIFSRCEHSCVELQYKIFIKSIFNPEIKINYETH